MPETSQPVQDVQGTLVDQSPKPTPASDTTPTQAVPQTSDTKTNGQAATTGTESSLINQESKPPEGAPSAYEPFTVPDGYELDEAVAKEAGELFKGLNLPQDAAQKLVDFYSAKTLELAQAPLKQWQEVRDGWRNEIKADPEIGGKLDLVRSTVNKAITGLGDPKLAADFKAAMDYTGAGDNPAFIRAFFKLAQQVTEGGSVKGNNPAPVTKPGEVPTAAKAMYPNLA